MTKELQDKTWAVLPKEFKEEVKKQWQAANNDERLPHDAYLRGCYSTMVELFGGHNLTSDADVEELKPAEPKFKAGDKVRISCVQDGLIWDNILHGRIATIKSAYLRPDNDSIWIYSFEEAIRDFAEDWLKPYTEPVEPDLKMVKHTDRRLNMAKDFASVLLGRLDYNPFMAHINCCCSDGEPVNPYRHIASIAVSVADALIAESEKGGKNHD